MPRRAAVLARVVVAERPLCSRTRRPARTRVRGGHAERGVAPIESPAIAGDSIALLA